jgi:hypothetical protein
VFNGDDEYIIPFFFNSTATGICISAERREFMRTRNIVLFVFLIGLFTIHGNNNTAEIPLPCGIYDNAAKPFITKDLVTQSFDAPRHTMAILTKRGKRLAVEVQNVMIRLPGERYHVSVFVNGKPYAKTSHQDLPLYLEVHVDNVKYRIICQR